MLPVALVVMVSLLSSSCRESATPPVAEPLGIFNQLSPATGAKEVTVTTSFTWEELVKADSYTLLVSTRSDFTSLAVEQKQLNTTNFTPALPLIEGTLYYWKVIAVNAHEEKLAENAGLSFRTQSSSPLPSPSITKYFISPDGEDNPDKGTVNSPFKTLAYAASRVPAGEGDTLYLKAGTYVETDPAIIPIGVNVIGAGEANTIISSKGITLAPGISAAASNFKLWYDGSLIQLVSAHRTSFRNNNSTVIAPANGNQTIAHFTVDGNNKSLKAGVWVENRNNVQMHHVTFKELSQRGAVFGPGDKDFYVYPQFYMTGTVIHDCTFINSGRDLSDETLGNLCIAQLDGADIYNIKIQDNQGYGIKFIYDGYFKNCKIHDCEISVNEADSKWGEDIAIELWNAGPGNKIYNINCNTWLSIVNHPDMFGAPAGTENMKVYNVKMIDKDGASGKEAIEIGAPGVEVYDSYFENKGFGMAIWDMGRGNITIRNNIFYNSVAKTNWASGAAVYIDNSRTWEFKNINIYNNVFDTHLVAVKIKGNSISNIHIKNNAFLNSGSEVEAVGSNIEFLNNLKYKENNNTWSVSGVTANANNIIGVPLFTNSGDRWNTFYRPLSNASFVIDKGANVTLPFTGSAPDIGAFEFQ